MINRYWKNQSKPANWREALQEIAEMRKELTDHGQDMHPYTRDFIERSIKQRAAELRPTIAGGVIGEYKQAIASVRAAREGIKKARAKEINRWDLSRLGAEMNTVRMFVENAAKAGSDPLLGTGPAARLEKLYAEAVESGDATRQRATFEVLADMLPVFASQSPDIRLRVNRIAKEAGQNLEQLRQTPEMVQAAEWEARAVNELVTRWKDVANTSRDLLGEDVANMFITNEFAQAARMVKNDPETGEIIVLSENDPEVTGVDWQKYSKNT